MFKKADISAGDIVPFVPERLWMVAESWSRATFCTVGSLVSEMNLNAWATWLTWHSSSALGIPKPPRCCGVILREIGFAYSRVNLRKC